MRKSEPKHPERNSNLYFIHYYQAVPNKPLNFCSKGFSNDAHSFEKKDPRQIDSSRKTNDLIQKYLNGYIDQQGFQLSLSEPTS